VSVSPVALASSLEDPRNSISPAAAASLLLPGHYRRGRSALVVAALVASKTLDCMLDPNHYPHPHPLHHVRRAPDEHIKVNGLDGRKRIQTKPYRPLDTVLLGLVRVEAGPCTGLFLVSDAGLHLVYLGITPWSSSL